MKRKLSSFAAVMMALVLSVLCITVFAEEKGDGSMTAVTADHWNALFDRSGKTNDWLCADGIYSVSLDGRDAIGSADENSKSFFIFSDSFVGNADESGTMSNYAMVNHSAMLFTGDTPSDDAADFIWGLRGDESLKNNIFGQDQWMFDLLCDGKNLYLFGFTHDASWKPGRIDMYTVPVTEEGVDLTSFKRKPFITELIHKTDEKHHVFSMGIMPNTETAGVKNPDGYYYFYGYRDNLDYAFFQTKDLIVARIHEKDFPDFKKLTYWDGTKWGTNIEESAPLIENVSCEVSVTPIDYGPNAGKYIAIYTEAVQSSHMRYALGDTPWGPFSESVEFYTAPETDTEVIGGNGVYYTYNAKAHPHLSNGNKLLVSYNVNVRGSAAKNCRDYYPRFLYLDLGGEIPEVTTAVTTEDAPVTETPTTDTPATSDQDPPREGGRILPVAICGAVLVTAAVGTAVFAITKKKKKS